MDCPDDDELALYVERALGQASRERIEAHFDRCSACRTLVSELTRSEAGEPLELLATEPVLRGVTTIPARIGRYVVEAPLGAGGSGVVVSAFDPELERKVAIKLLRGDRGHGPQASAARARLTREARAMARVTHPNVVAVHDVGEADGQLFVAMELVCGQTLRSWLAFAARSQHEIVRVFLDAGRGLAAAHQVGLVHRDFKPDNVLVGDDGRVYVTDFGLAGLRAHEGASRAAVSTTSAPLTRSGMALGTPLYMAPEQRAGGTVDARADQFAFCVALYEALLGRHPFLGHALAGSPPLEPEVPSALLEVLRQGLATEPSRRFADMGALLGAIERASAPSGRGALRLLAVLSLLLLVLGLTVWLVSPAGAPQLRAESANTQADASHVSTLMAPVVVARPQPAAAAHEDRDTGSALTASRQGDPVRSAEHPKRARRTAEREPASAPHAEPPDESSAPPDAHAGDAAAPELQPADASQARAAKRRGPALRREEF